MIVKRKPNGDHMSHHFGLLLFIFWQMNLVLALFSALMTIISKQT